MVAAAVSMIGTENNLNIVAEDNNLNVAAEDSLASGNNENKLEDVVVNVADGTGVLDKQTKNVILVEAVDTNELKNPFRQLLLL